MENTDFATVLDQRISTGTCGAYDVAPAAGQPLPGGRRAGGEDVQRRSRVQEGTAVAVEHLDVGLQGRCGLRSARPDREAEVPDAALLQGPGLGRAGVGRPVGLGSYDVGEGDDVGPLRAVRVPDPVAAAQDRQAPVEADTGRKRHRGQEPLTGAGEAQSVDDDAHVDRLPDRGLRRRRGRVPVDPGEGGRAVLVVRRAVDHRCAVGDSRALVGAVDESPGGRCCAGRTRRQAEPESAREDEHQDPTHRRHLASPRSVRTMALPTPPHCARQGSCTGAAAPGAGSPGRARTPGLPSPPRRRAQHAEALRPRSPSSGPARRGAGRPVTARARGAAARSAPTPVARARRPSRAAGCGAGAALSPSWPGPPR